MRIAISGTSGYVGGSLMRYFRSKGDEVRELRRLRPGERRSEQLFHFALGEPLDPATFDGIDALVHCAYDFKPIEWEEIERVNIRGSTALHHAAMERGIRRQVFISSISAFEESSSMYGRAKLTVEREVSRIGAAVIRPGLVFGDSPGAMVGTLMRLVETLPLIPLMGARQELYLCHESDLGELVSKCLISAPFENPKPLFACAPVPIRFGEILRLLARRAGRTPLFVPIPWRAAWCGLRVLEALNVRIGIKSDSLISLMNPNPHPEFSPPEELRTEFRSFLSP